MIRIGHPYRDRAPDAPPPSDDPVPNPFDLTSMIDALDAKIGRAEEALARIKRERRIAIELDVANRDEVERSIEEVREATRLGADARAGRRS